MTLNPTDREEIVAKLISDYRQELAQLNDTELYHSFKMMQSIMGKPGALEAVVSELHHGLNQKGKKR